jgi:hypothetical protein
MRLTVEQSRKALAEHGMYVTECCDACRKLLGCVRYTIRGEPGEWCSEACRDGIEQAQARAQRRIGRPRKYRSAAQRDRAEREQGANRQRVFRDRLRVTGNPLGAS